MASNGLLITNSTIHNLKQDKLHIFNGVKYWHKFIVKNGGKFDKETVLQGVLNSIKPFDLVPVKYTVVGSDAYFLARNCGAAIEKFCSNLLIPIKVNSQGEEVTISIQTCVFPVDEFKVNMRSHLLKALRKRYNNQSTINLTQFHKESELYETLYCPLSVPKFLLYVLSIIKPIFQINALNLSNNNIQDLKPLKALEEFKQIISLNLSYNQIDNHKSIKIISEAVPGLQELDLRGNPFCSQFKSGVEYVIFIKQAVPTLRKLDGFSLTRGYPNHQVWLCEEKAWYIINEFLKHYFTFYDNFRKLLEHVYSADSIFSMSCSFQFSGEDDEEVKVYQCESKHLVKTQYIHKIVGLFHYKNSNIIKVLENLPKTEHDVFSFKVDLPRFDKELIILIVSGVFKDFQKYTRFRSFSRTFVLKKYEYNEYKITNDIYHVTNASQTEIESSILHSKLIGQKEDSSLFLNNLHQRYLIREFEKLTEMNSDYSRRCLEDCDWDFKKSLETFLQNYKCLVIPPEAFSKN